MLGLEVVVLRRQAEAVLEDKADLLAGVLEIRAGAEIEHVLVAFVEAGIEEFGDVCTAFQRVDLGESRLDRIETGLVDRCVVHAGGIQVADLLLERTRLGAGGALLGVFGDLALFGQALFMQFVE